MSRNVPWHRQPPHLTPIRTEFNDSSLLVALEGYPLPHVYHRLAGSTAQAKVINASYGASAGTGVTRSYTVSATETRAIQVATFGANPDCVMEFNTNMSWTFMCRISGLVLGGASPGFWRTASSESGTTFFIDNGSTRRPWVRVNGVDILKAASGDQWPTVSDAPFFDVLVRFANASFVDVWWGGKKRHSATHSTSQSAATGSANGVVTIGRRDINFYNSGQYAAVRLWSKALSDTQCARLTENAWVFYQPALRGIFPGFAGAAGGVFIPIIGRGPGLQLSGGRGIVG